MLGRLRDNWVYGGFLAALMLLALTPVLAAGWSQVLLLIWLQLPIYMLQQLGELVVATGADTLTVDELAGALVALADRKDATKREAWARLGAAFFLHRARRSAATPDRDNGGVLLL